MQVKSIAECSKGSILQYFRSSLSYQLLLRSLFCLFLSGPFTQALLYIKYGLFYRKCSKIVVLNPDFVENTVDPDQMASDKAIWPEVIKLFHAQSQLSTKFQLLIKTKIPTNKEVSCIKSLRCCI